MADAIVQARKLRNRTEVDLLLSCARTQITPKISDRIRLIIQNDVDWMALIRLALCHETLPLLYRTLQQVCPNSVPGNISGPIRARCQEQAAQAKRHAEEISRMVPLFEAEKILPVPYKGPALAQRLYGDLSLRESSDIDIMVLERDVPRAQELIRRLGYKFACLEDTSKLDEYIRANRELQFYRSDGMLVELHWRFAMQLACVKNDPERFLRRFETIFLAGQRVTSLPLEVYLLVLSLHATKHKWRKLKLICDVAEILGHADLDWKYVLREAGDLGLKRMLAVGILLAQDLLEVVVPPELAEGLKIDNTARALAAQVCRSLFEEPDDDWHEQADFPFQLRIRERLRDRARMVFRNLPAKLAPDERDRLFLPMPESFAFLYYAVRPVRLAWEKMNDE